MILAFKKNDVIGSKLKKNFNKRQIMQVNIGIRHGIDASIYYHDYISYQKMRLLRLRLEHGVSVAKTLHEFRIFYEYGKNQ